MRDLGTLGGAYSTGQAINGRGQIAGWSDTANSSAHAFLYDGVAMHDLRTLGGEESFAYGINDSGQVVGYSRTNDSYFARAFRWTPTIPNGNTGAMIDLGGLDGGLSVAYDINENGDVTGYARVLSGLSAPEPLAYCHAFLHDGTTMHDLGTLEGFRYSHGMGINNYGQVVGLSSSSYTSGKSCSAALGSPDSI